MTQITGTDCSGYNAIRFEYNEQMHFQLVAYCKRDYYNHFSQFSRLNSYLIHPQMLVQVNAKGVLSGKSAKSFKILV